MVTPQYTDEFVKQSNEITENIVSAVRSNSQLTVNTINAAAENFRALNRTVESVTEFNTSAGKAWNSFLTVQQQFPTFSDLTEMTVERRISYLDNDKSRSN